MKTTRLVAALCAASAAFVGAQNAQATVLTFDITGLAPGNELPQGYGDNATATTMGTFSYGSTGGFTPNVSVEYDGFSTQSNLNWWDNGYSDLTNVVEYEPDGAGGYSITFIAAPGHSVTLVSFDIGNWGSQVTLPVVKVIDQNSQELFAQTDVVLPSSSNPHISFSPGVTGQSLTLIIDTAGLGNNSDNVGLDNILFTEAADDTTIPEPASLSVLALGGFALLARRRR